MNRASFKIAITFSLFSSVVFLGTSFALVPFVFAQTTEEPMVTEPTTETTPPAEESTTPTTTTETTPMEATPSTESSTEPTTLPETAPTETATTEEASVLPEDEVVTPVEVSTLEADLEAYTKYSLFLKWEKKEIYKKYVRYRDVAYKYPWESSSKNLKKIKKNLKKDYDKYQKYVKSPKKNAKYAGLKSRYDDYRLFDALRAEYFFVKPYAGYAHYIQFDKPVYDQYKNYGTAEYKAGYERYKAAIAAGTVPAPKETDIDTSTLGKPITVGLYNYTTTDLKNGTFKIKANHGMRILSKNDNLVGEVPAHVRVVVKYLGDKEFSIVREDTGAAFESKKNEIRFVPVAGHETDTIFDITRPNSSFDRYRDGIRLRYYDSPEADADRIWVINVLPLEHYVWGMGEITGTGPVEYNRVMTTIYRTYGYWKILYSTKYAPMGFKVDATSGSQIYYGYDWEVAHDNIRQAAEVTRGRIITYNNEPALTPYSSWTDGRTRRYEDGHWGHKCDKESSKTSNIYPWLSEASDSWGKHPTSSTCDLANGGNHMVGLSAHGALNQAKEGRGYLSILTHYYKGVAINPAY